MWLSIVDMVLVVWLFLGAFDVINTEAYVSALGMTHGVFFVLLTVVTAAGALMRQWTWVFPVGTLVSAGILFPLIAEFFLRRRLNAADPQAA